MQKQLHYDNNEYLNRLPFALLSHETMTRVLMKADDCDAEDRGAIEGFCELPLGRKTGSARAHGRISSVDYSHVQARTLDFRETKEPVPRFGSLSSRV